MEVDKRNTKVRKTANARNPSIGSGLGEETANQGVKVLTKAGIPVFQTPGQAMKGISYLTRHRQSQIQLMRCPPVASPAEYIDQQAATRIIDDVIRDGRSILSEPEAKSVLSAYGIPVAETRIVATPEEAEATAHNMFAAGSDVRLALKLLSHDITHKSDVGGVLLDLATPNDVRVAALSMLSRVGVAAPGAKLDGLVLQPMIQRPDAHELIVGLIDDRVFGPVVLFGAGGLSVEVVADKTVSLPPLDTMLAADMLDRTRIGRLLRGYRNRPAANRDAIERALVSLSHMALDLAPIVELDINPLLADAEGVIALDARIVVKPGRAGQRSAIRPYPIGWSTVVTCAKGPILIRPIKPSDEVLYPPFIELHSKAEIKFRFFGSFSPSSHHQIARLFQIYYATPTA